jgi:hypothetical protein
MKLVMLITMCLHETYSKVQLGKNLSDAFPVQNGLKKDALSPVLTTLLQNMPSGRLKKIRKDRN